MYQNYYKYSLFFQFHALLNLIKNYLHYFHIYLKNNILSHLYNLNYIYQFDKNILFFSLPLHIFHYLLLKIKNLYQNYNYNLVKQIYLFRKHIYHFLF